MHYKITSLSICGLCYKRGKHTGTYLHKHSQHVPNKSCPHGGYSDCIFVMLRKAYRPLVINSKPVLQQVITWPAGADGNSTNWEEYMSSGTSYISKCINDVTVF